MRQSDIKTPTESLSFSGSSNTSLKVDVKQLSSFLNFVAQGEQDQAEKLLQNNAQLAIIPGDVTDLSGRAFKGITGFQYAVWALDSHMWTMIRNYLPNEVARDQIQGIETGSWVNQHGIHANWDNLITALKTYIDNYQSWTVEQCTIQWNQQVGGAQLLLPVHVVNQYCHPTRSFDPCPNYRSLDPLPRSRNVQVYSGAWFFGRWKKEKEWFASTVEGQELGKTFAFCRAKRGLATGFGSIKAGMWPRAVAGVDGKSLSALYSARMDQRNDLLTELKLIDSSKKSEALSVPELSGSTLEAAEHQLPIQRLLHHGHILRSSNPRLVRIEFNVLQYAKDFVAELLKIGFDNRMIPSEAKKIEASLADPNPNNNNTQDRYFVELTADEWDALQQNEQAFAKMENRTALPSVQIFEKFSLNESSSTQEALDTSHSSVIAPFFGKSKLKKDMGKDEVQDEEPELFSKPELGGSK